MWVEAGLDEKLICRNDLVCLLIPVVAGRAFNPLLSSAGHEVY